MATPDQIGTFARALGSGSDDRIIAGDTWTRDLVFTDSSTKIAVDFTGWTPVFEVIDSSGTLLETGSVSPSPGDTTGIFEVTLSTAQTTALLGTNTFRLAITFGADRHTLVCGPFVVSGCP